MTLLFLFALIAGAGTALSPCVLPILPAVLGAGLTGGRGRPLGVVTGLVASFTFSAVALVYLIEALGLPNDIQRTIAIAVLVGFGVSLLVPPLSGRIEAAISRLVGGPRIARGEGFWSGAVLGGGLGLIYTPCAGPILAGVITVSAAQEFTVGRLAVALAYGLGTGAVLLAVLKGGRRLTDRLAAWRGQVQAAIGTMMIAVAVLMAADLDVRFQNAIADDLPAFLTNPTGDLERSGEVAAGIADVRGLAVPHMGPPESGADEIKAGEELRVVFEAPHEFESTQRWFNTGGEELSIEQLTDQGKVVLVDFWTYTCINCIRTFPQLRAWDERYRDDGLVIVGVHTPEFPFERDADNVRAAIEQNELRYPIVQDNDYAVWTAFANRAWPAKYLIDSRGRVRFTHFGEGEYGTTEEAIRRLLANAGSRGSLGGRTRAPTGSSSPGVSTPETYLGSERARGFVSGPIESGAIDFDAPSGRDQPSADGMPPDSFAFRGRWRVFGDGATALGGAQLDARFRAARVFLVMGSPDRDRSVRVLLDGEPIAPRDSGADVRGGRVRVGEQRLYRLVDLPRAEQRRLSLRFPPGVSGYAFTFG